MPSDRWLQGKTELIVQNFQQIASNWRSETLRNYPNAIETYKVLIREISHKKFAVADALFQVGSLTNEMVSMKRNPSL